MTNQLLDDSVEQQTLQTFTEKAYLDYSMYVILDRALPHIGDGLKPVQRRIVYAMSELGLKSTAKHKKSARTVGDVLGKFHPHGDSACYEAMVLMAQPFSYRYPMVDGQGNWGSPDDPKSFAAMRYTESKLAKYADTLLSELGQGTVDFIPNFDGTMEEPCVLPSRLPNLLLNGTTGIAVGMATDIPPHNLQEVVNATTHLIDNPNASVSELMQFIKAPDFPTGGELISTQSDIEKTYKTGRGSVKLRAKYEIENGDVIITELPYQVSGAKILEQIAAQMIAKKLPMVSDLRDESDHENPTRLLIEPRSNRVDIEQMMNHLFATTDLEKSYRMNFNIIGLDGRPKVHALNETLTQWLIFRKDTVKRRLQYRLDKVIARLHILDALLIAFLNIDEVIEIIRTHDKPKAELIARFDLSETQAEAILDLKLRHLAKLEEMKIKGEQDELQKEREKLEKILGSEARMRTLIKKELLADAKEFGDERRSVLITRGESKALTEEDLLSNDPVTVVLSEKGWIRAAKGHEVDASALNYKSGDGYLMSAKGRTNQKAVILDSAGRSFTLATHSLPSARGQGEPVSGRVNLNAAEKIRGLTLGSDSEHYLLSTDAGYGYVCKFEDMQSRAKNGKAQMSVSKGANIFDPVLIEDAANQLLVSVSNEGRMLVFPVKDLPVLGKGKGNKIINIAAAKVESREEYMVACALVNPEQSLIIQAGKRKLTLKPVDLEYYRAERGRRGSKLPRGLQKVSGLVVE